MDYAKTEVYNLDGQTQLEFLNRKTLVVIDRDRFSICKQLMLENAGDEDFAEFLNIPPEKVRYFKYKVQLFEDAIRARRRAARLKSKRRRRQQIAKPPPKRKREISSEERFRKARDLIARNFSTNQISKILKVSERSVTRFRSRIRAEKMKLSAEGKLKMDPDDPDDENSFKHLRPEDKVKRARELFKRRLRITEISEILKISERSVRRWKEKLNRMANEPDMAVAAAMENKKSDRPRRMLKVVKTNQDEYYEEIEKPPPKKRKVFVDREKVQYARELIENKLSNKEMSVLLEMSIACVRKLKMKILNNTVEEMIDNSEEHYTKLVKQDDEDGEIELDPDIDPLNLLEPLPEACTSIPVAPINYGYERKPKVILRDREMYMVSLLRQNNVRTMDIAKMMKISERSVTRLLAKSRELEVIEYELSVVEEVERMMAEKDTILDEQAASTSVSEPAPVPFVDDSKRQLGMNLLTMHVKTKDIAQMLDVCEKTVQRWKAKMQSEMHEEEEEEEEDEEVEEAEDEDGHPIFNDLLEAKLEQNIEDE